MNPDFFKGTVLEDSAARVVAELLKPVRCLHKRLIKAHTFVLRNKSMFVWTFA